MVGPGDVGLDPLHREAGGEGALTGELEEPLACVHRPVGHAAPRLPQRLEQNQVLVPLARSEALDLEGAGWGVPSQVRRGARDERAGPDEIPVGAVRAKREPGTHG